MPFEETDFDDIITELKPIIEALPVSEVSLADLPLVGREWLQSPCFGSIDEALVLLKRSLKDVVGKLGEATDWTVKVGLSEEFAHLGYLEIFWRYWRPPGTSINAPQVVIRRSPTRYEVLLNTGYFLSDY